MTEKRLAEIGTVRENIEILFPVGQMVEVRAYSKHAGGYPFGQRFTDHDEAAGRIKQLSDSRTHEGIYFVLNEFPAGTVFEKASSAVADRMVSRRIWLFLDFDTVFTRPQHPQTADWIVDPGDSKEIQKEKKAKIAHHKWQHGNATAVELAASEHAAREIQKFLGSLGWPDPYVFFSGNGHHVLYRIDLANTDENLELVNAVTAGIDSVLSSLLLIGDAECDRSTTNAARITKAYGSFTMKGQDSPDRPHRYSGLIERGSDAIVTREQMEFFVRLCALGAGTVQPPTVTAKSDIRVGIPAGAGSLGLSALPGVGVPDRDKNTRVNDEKTVAEMLAFLEHCRVTDKDGGTPEAVRGTWKKTEATGWKIHVSCAWSDEHTSIDTMKDSTIWIPDVGDWAYNCLHSHCDGIRSWNHPEELPEERGRRSFRKKVNAGREQFSFTDSSGSGHGHVFFGDAPLYNAEVLTTDLSGKDLLICEGQASLSSAAAAGIAAVGIISCNPDHVAQVAAAGKLGARIIITFNREAGLAGDWISALKRLKTECYVLGPEDCSWDDYVKAHGSGLYESLGLKGSR